MYFLDAQTCILNMYACSIMHSIHACMHLVLSSLHTRRQKTSMPQTSLQHNKHMVTHDTHKDTPQPPITIARTWNPRFPPNQTSLIAHGFQHKAHATDGTTHTMAAHHIQTVLLTRQCTVSTVAAQTNCCTPAAPTCLPKRAQLLAALA